MKRRMRLKLLVVRLVIGAAFLAAWELVSGRLVDALFVSAPSKVVPAVWDLFAERGLLSDLGTTFYEAGVGYLIGIGGGCLLALALSRLPFVVSAIEPYVMAFYGIPRVALAPLFLIWFGIGAASKIVLVASVVFFIGFLNTLAGLREVDLGLISTVRALGASERQLFTKVRIPAASPWIFVGLRISVPYALVAAIVGEFLAASKGLGFTIQRAGSALNTAEVMAIVVVLAVLVIALNGVLSWVESRLFGWKPVEERAGGTNI